MKRFSDDERATLGRQGDRSKGGFVLAVMSMMLGAAGGCQSGGSAGGSGGANGSGGAGTGGAFASGGTPGSGGGTGGVSASGGTPGSGGAGTGGTTGGGGAATGGAVGSGGAGTGGRGGAVGSGGRATGGGSGSGGAGGSVASPSGLPVPPGAAGMPRPMGTPGAITVLDWAGFKAAVSYTFDDTNSSQIARYPDLKALGVRMTFYLITNKSEISNAVWTQAFMDGHELGNHTQSHQQTGTGADVDAGANDIRQRFGGEVWTMAAPYGDPSYTALARTRYLINRGVNNGLMAPNDNTDPFSIYCFIPAANAPASAFNAQIDSARAMGRWRTVLVHGFTGGSDSAYQPVAFAEFASSVNYAKAFGDVWIDSVVNVGSYWRGQKAFSAATMTMSGTSRTWTWTLPDHFPPGKYLRVKVDGGTLTQGSQTLAWDDHGYYEVALDAKSLTLSP
jgi:peptidoglycan/xylan/chitin deacetylase (PgdA/CDA1 family)